MQALAQPQTKPSFFEALKSTPKKLFVFFALTIIVPIAFFVLAVNLAFKALSFVAVALAIVLLWRYWGINHKTATAQTTLKTTPEDLIKLDLDQNTTLHIAIYNRDAAAIIRIVAACEAQDSLALLEQKNTSGITPLQSLGISDLKDWNQHAAMKTLIQDAIQRLKHPTTTSHAQYTPGARAAGTNQTIIHRPKQDGVEQENSKTGLLKSAS